ncbi:MAG: FAD-dependent oxidoreductase, partial [Gammaproteobacteria bacterium]|nr:FAD-dependent oxidoreductase [Gammaproteobacteria bacterium]
MIYDLIVIGGGINGAGIAAEASRLGLKVFLAEKNDFASGTSSSSTKLIHGGLRYLEHYDFKLVFSALRERARLQALAPHIIWPIEFILINNPKIRHAWLIRLGLFVYDLLDLFSKYNKTKLVKLKDIDDNNIFKTGYKYT